MRITVAALAAALLGSALSAFGHAPHPYAVVIGCAALGALIAFFAVGRPPAQRLTVELLLAVNVAALALLYGRSLPWPAILALLAWDVYYVTVAVRAHRARSELAAWRHPSLAPEEVQQERAGRQDAADAEYEERPRGGEARGH